ncbi:hypothetical protein [Microbacterium sp.]|uniref:hypothetical protein n=1 Tax=Microbacterium sp. TaxID=51671 RepID=UPI003A906EA4
MQLTSTDLLQGLGWLALWLAITGVILAFSIWRARRRGSTTLALDVTRNASLAYLGVAAFGIVMSGLQRLGSGSLALEGAAGQWVAEQQDALHSPTCDATGTFHVELSPAQGPAPISYCQNWLENVPVGPRLTVYLGTLMGILASAAIAWAIYTATRRAGVRDPFHPSVSRTFGFASIAVMVGGAMSTLVTSIGMTLAARSLQWEPEMTVPFELSIPLWPFAVAVGLFALSAIFRYGRQLQLEKERLQRETDGLV